jgi:drug/metabolite transporter (DMT)-like permease
MLKRARLTAFDILLYGIVVLAWGFAWIGIHFQVGVVSPDVSILWRFLIAGAVMLALAWWRGDRLRFTLQEHARFALLGVLLFCLNFLLFYNAADTLPSGLLSIVFSLASFINVWLGAIFLGAPIDRRVVLGGLLGALGMAAMFYPQFEGSGFKQGAAIALVLCVLGTFAFCFGNMVSAMLQRRSIPVFPASGYGMLYGCAAIALYAAIRGHAFIIDWSPSYLISLVYLALIGSVVAFASYLTLLGRIGADRAAYVTVLGPVVALVVSTFVENFRWSLPAMIGLGAVLIGNVLVLRPAKKS